MIPNVHNLERVFPHFWALSPNASIRALALFIAVAKSPGGNIKSYREAGDFKSNTASATFHILAAEKSPELKHKALLACRTEGTSSIYTLTPLGNEVWKLLSKP